MYKMKSNVVVPAADMAVAEQFANCVFWEEGNEALFTDDFVLDLPYAPPGMFQHLTKSERPNHFDWLRHTVSNWKWSDIKVLGTDQKDCFWVFRTGEGDTLFGDIKGTYKSKFATLLKISDAKIYYVKDHFDMMEFYRAMGIELPVFYYDAKPAEEFEERKPAPVVDHTEETMAAQIKKTLEFFESPNYWDPAVNEVLADDFLHELTFAPKNMPRIYRGREYDSLNEWLERHLLGGGITDEVFYVTTDPHIYVTEYNCLFETNWGFTPEELAAGAHGKYPNREISYIELDDNGRCKRLDEYLNSMSKFLSSKKTVPSFPYMYY